MQPCSDCPDTLAQRLRACEEDPMWADHAEVPKRLCAAAATELERLTACLAKANANHERFERDWYLRGDEIERLTAELAAARELADSEGTRAVDYMRRARKAEKLLREVLDALPGLQAPNCLGMDLYQRVSAATAPKAERAAIDAARGAKHADQA